MAALVGQYTSKKQNLLVVGLVACLPLLLLGIVLWLCARAGVYMSHSTKQSVNDGIRRPARQWLAALSGAALMTVSVSHAAAVEINAPAEALVGSEVPVAWTGEANARDFITIVAPDAAEGAYKAYQYANKSPVTLVAPVEPGTYEIRYLDADAPYPTLARRPLTINDTSATLLAPDSVEAGAAFDVSWTGPDHKQDFITIVPAGTPENQYRTGYAYTGKGSPLKLVAPDAAGEYELRYLMGHNRLTARWAADRCW